MHECWTPTESLQKHLTQRKTKHKGSCREQDSVDRFNIVCRQHPCETCALYGASHPALVDRHATHNHVAVEETDFIHVLGYVVVHCPEGPPTWHLGLRRHHALHSRGRSSVVLLRLWRVVSHGRGPIVVIQRIIVCN